ncbi:hypothetical protein [Bacillus paranthracis]|uniref:hypothetical protein n=1 Tax=Bacillus paranthracis TaxID=2026186 RepID=UPI002FDC35AB
MDINLVRNDRLLIDQDILNGINNNAILFNVDEKILNYLNTNYEEGNELPLIPYGVERHAYEIISNSDRVGIIILSLEEDPQYGMLWEVIILIFERFQGQGFSKTAINELIRLNSEISLRATIHQHNEAKQGLEKVLSDLGFIVIQPDGGATRS